MVAIPEKLRQNEYSFFNLISKSMTHVSNYVETTRDGKKVFVIGDLAYRARKLPNGVILDIRGWCEYQTVQSSRAGINKYKLKVGLEEVVGAVSENPKFDCKLKENEITISAKQPVSKEEITSFVIGGVVKSIHHYYHTLCTI